MENFCPFLYQGLLNTRSLKISGETMTNQIEKTRPVRMKSFIKSALAGLANTLPFAVIGAVIAAAPLSPSEASSSKLVFEFTCETSEAEFYDWIETELWPQGSTAAFGRNLDAAFDVLTSTSKNAWAITLPEAECHSDVLLESRREALYSMLDDAAQDGHGEIRRKP